ncbi:hypothetical protein CY35_02G099800 [Sphagnum magellanicum]|nr:hypothetical protein CY35_02G099800 [Sphagnum magellanicum]
MEVTEENFELLLPQIEESLRSCEMCAIDAEFTGLSLTNPRREEVLDDAEQRYARVRTSAQNFLIMQFGLATFHWSTLTGCYEAQTYNFYVFPRPSGGMDYRFTCQASSLDFLREHGFDFNKFIYSGIPYVTLEQMRREKRSESQAPRDPIVLKQEEDRNFVTQQMENVRCWVDSTQPCDVGNSSSDSQPATLVLDPSNSYLRAALYQQLEQEYGKSEFYVERLATVGSRKSSLRLTRATTEVIAAQESEVTAKRQRQLEHAVGFANVMQALTTCNKPVVGHNMLLDLAYLYHQFVGHLPPSLDEFRKQVQILFPAGIYDTKYLAGLFPVFLPSTSLEDIYTALASETITAIGHMDGIVGFDANKFSNFLPTAPDDIEKEGVLHATKAPMKSDVLHTLFADLAECSKDVDMQLTKVELPGVVHSSLFDRYKTTGDAPHHYHEAGFDAYMTGTIFIWLSKLFEARSTTSAPDGHSLNLQVLQEHCNKVYVMRIDLPYLPLQGPIPVADRSSLFLLTAADGLPLPSTDEIMLRFSTIGCDITRILWLDQITCYVTLKDSSQAPSINQALAKLGWRVNFSPYGTATGGEPMN